MKKVISLMLVLCMVFALCACGQTAAPAATEEKAEETVEAAPVEKEVEEDGEFIINACISSEPETIDPNTVNSVDGSTYVQHMFENLMKYQVTDELAAEDDSVYLTEVVPGQAESYEVSDDLTVYTFHLRDDIYWSDGEPVKAQDWVYSW